MPKRYLTVQNKENEQPQISTPITRSASKRVSTDEPIPAKRAKTEDKQANKENSPSEPKSPLVNSPILPIVDGPDQSKSNAYDADDDESSVTSITIDDSDDTLEDDEPISSIADDDNAGEDHPTNNQYFVYKNRNPKKENFIISKTARYWSLRYRKVLVHVNPDLYGMYIHNDFNCYGELEVVENCLLDLTKTIFVVQQGLLTQLRKSEDKVNYPLAFRRLEALTILLDYTKEITGIDDGERFDEIIRVIGACYVTILQGLLPRVMFENIEAFDEILVKKLKKISKQLPNFKQVLEQALIIGHFYQTIGDVCSAYTKILQVYFLYQKNKQNLIFVFCRLSIVIGFWLWSRFQLI